MLEQTLGIKCVLNTGLTLNSDQISDTTKGGLATFPGNLFQCLITLVVKKFSI